MDARIPRTTTKHRVLLVGALFAVMTLLSACLNTGQTQVLDAMNADRKAYGRKTLPTQYDAQKKAQAWAEKLARENTLYHSNLPSGINVRWCALGENVGYGSTVAAVEKAYMNSPGHKANILNTTWNGVGVGYAKNGSRVFTVQFFIKTC